jgi:polyisoprenoid-binding protein YceI
MVKHIAFIVCLAAANVYAIKGTAEFVAKATPGFLKIEGKGGVVEAKSAAVDSKGLISGEFIVDVRQLKTGSDKRDKHMNQYLETEKHPYAILKLDPIPVAQGKKNWKGIFTLHGVSNPVAGEVEFTSATKAIASFSVDVSKYGVKGLPQYELLTVGKEVNITVELEI